MRGVVYYDTRDDGEYSVIKFTEGINAVVLSDIAAIHDEDPKIQKLGEAARLLNISH